VALAFQALEMPYLAAGALMLGLAAALLYLNLASRPNRAFALVLALRGMSILASGFSQLENDPASVVYWARLYPYFMLPLGPAVLYFAAVYPRRRTFLGRRPAGLLALVVAAVAMEGAYVADHRLFWDLAALPPGAGAFDAFGGDAAKGPLFVAGWGMFTLAVAAGAWLFARDAMRAGQGPGWKSHLLVSLGFALFATYDNLANLTSPSPIWRLSPGIAPLIWAPFVLALAVVVAIAVELAGRARRSPDPVLRAGGWRYLVALLLAAASWGLTAGFPAGGAASALGTFFSGVWRLALPVLVTYALARHQLFGIDLKIKWTIKQSTVAAAFIGVFFVASELAQTVLSQEVGPVLGIAAAGLLVLAMAPLQRAAERVASAAMPGVRAPQELSPDQRHDLYREQARVAWSDGTLTADERRMLNVAREKLGLTVEEAARLEAEVAPA
jgi:hypothetical protein